MMNYKKQYTEMRELVLNVLRKAKKPMVATQVAKLLGYRSGAVLYCLMYKWKDDVVRLNTISVTFKAIR